MSEMTWAQMNDLETLTYDMRALLEVVSDGLLNETCPSNTEDSAAVIRQAIDKLEKVREIHEEMWSEQREARADGGTDEDDDGEENFDTKDLFSDYPFTADEINVDPKEMSETVYEAQKRNDESSTSFSIEELAKHEDGSATYTLNASDEDMKKLFEAFFIQALINGIKYTAADNKKEIAKTEALEVAREFEVLMREWETSDDFDYAPVCKAKREKLAGALEAAGL